MPRISIEPVVSRRDKHRFLEYPWQQYRGDPNWIPPLRMDQKEMVNFSRHPFYNKAEIQTFLALRDGQPVGRIAAILNHAHNERWNEKRGFWGFFESIDDAEVAAGLFEAVRNWHEKKGVYAIRGPVNPSLNYVVGLLVEGFDSPPTFMMSYNPPYYERLVLASGYVKTQDAYAYWGHWGMLDTMDKKVNAITEECKKRFQLNLRRLNRRRFNEDVRIFLDIYNKSLIGTWGFVPLSEAEVDHMAAGMKQLIVPEMTSFCEVNGQPVGAVFGLLDYNPRIKLIDGRLFPFGFLRLLWNRRAIKKIRVISANVLPEWQAWGLGMALLSRFVPDCAQWGIKEGEFSWILESNRLSWGTAERAGAIRQKTYRIYDYAAGEPRAKE